MEVNMPILTQIADMNGYSGKRFDDRSYDLSDSLKYYNPLNIPELFNGPIPLIPHVFVQRPKIYMEEGSPNLLAAKKLGDFNQFITNPKKRQMLKMLTGDNPIKFLPNFYSRAKGAAFAAAELASVERGATYNGNAIHYLKYDDSHMKGGNINLTFRNDRDMSVFMTCWAWHLYIYYVTKTVQMAPIQSHIENGILDYAGAIYVFFTDVQMNIIFFRRWMGTAPKDLPFDILSSDGEAFVIPEYSIGFEYSHASPYNDLSILYDFNEVSGATKGNFNFLNVSNDPLYKKGPTRPVITRRIDKGASAKDLSKIVEFAGEYTLSWQE